MLLARHAPDSPRQRWRGHLPRRGPLRARTSTADAKTGVFARHGKTDDLRKSRLNDPAIRAANGVVGSNQLSAVVNPLLEHLNALGARKMALPGLFDAVEGVRNVGVRLAGHEYSTSQPHFGQVK